MSGESVSTYPRRPKAEAFSNAVDVVERLHDPTSPSTKRTAPPCPAHIQLGDVPRSLEAEGEFRQLHLRPRESSVNTTAWRR